MNLPDDFRCLFKNYVFETVDTEKHASVIIKTVLSYGRWEQIMRLFRHYGRRKIRSVFLEDYYGLRNLPASTRSLWETIFVEEIVPEPDDPAEKWSPRRQVPESKVSS